MCACCRFLYGLDPGLGAGSGITSTMCHVCMLLSLRVLYIHVLLCPL